MPINSAYKNLVSKKTFDKLTQRSQASREELLGNKPFQSAMMSSMQQLQEIVQAESSYIKELEIIAVDAFKNAYPIVDQVGIKIEVKLGPQDMNIKQDDASEEQKKDSEKRRRIINAITQGASFRGTKSYYLIQDALDKIDDTLIEKYAEIIGNAYGIYDDDDFIAMALYMLAQNQGTQGGHVEVEWNEEEDNFTIRAMALIFPILIQELVKGLYEIVSLQGFTGSEEENKKIVHQVDRAAHEPEDFRYGKFIYDALSQHWIDSGYENPVLRELLFAEIYKLPDEEFFSMVENSINEELTDNQKQWVKRTLDRLDRENKQ